MQPDSHFLNENGRGLTHIFTEVFSRMYATQEDKLRESMFHVKKWRTYLKNVNKNLLKQNTLEKVSCGIILAMIVY